MNGSYLSKQRHGDLRKVDPGTAFKFDIDEWIKARAKKGKPATTITPGLSKGRFRHSKARKLARLERLAALSAAGQS